MGDFSYLFDDLADVTGDKSYLKQKPQIAVHSNGWWTPDRVDQAVTHLQRNANLSPIGAQGLVARWANVEAQGGPNAVNPNSGAVGIGQWLGNRKAGVPSDFEGQLNHAVRELNTTESAAAKRLRMAQTPEDAAIGASMFERAEGYDPKTGRDNFVDPTIRAMKQSTPPKPNYDWAHQDVADIIGNKTPQQPDYSFAHQDIADILADNKGGQPITEPSQTVNPQIPVGYNGKPMVAPTDVPPAQQPVLANVDPSKLFGGNVTVAPSAAPMSSPEDLNYGEPIQPISTPQAPVQPVTATPTAKTQPQVTQMPHGVTTDSKFVDEANDVTTDAQGNVIQPAQPVARPTQIVTPNQTDNAVDRTIQVKPDATPRQVLEQIAPIYGIDVNKVLAENPNLKIVNNNGKVDLTYGDLKSMGVDTAPLIRQKQIENRVENPTPDLRSVPYDLAKTTVDDINSAAIDSHLGDLIDNTFGLPTKSTAELISAGLGQQIGSLGDFGGAMSGIMQLLDEASPVTNAVKEINGEKALAGNVLDWGKKLPQLMDEDAKAPKAKRIFQDADATNLAEFYKNANDVMNQTGGKNPDGSPTVPTQLMRFGVKSGNDIARLAALSMLPGGSITAFALDGAALAKLNGGSAADVATAALKGGLTGGLFHVVPPSVRKMMGVGEDVAESTAHKVGRAAAESGLVFGGSLGIGAATGDPIKENLMNAALNTAFHFTGLAQRALDGKTVHVEDADGNQLYAEIKKDGTLETIPPQKVDYETVVPMNQAERRATATVPETAPEPERQYSSALDEIRQNQADTTAKVQALFPDAQLPRQEAADLRRQAWDNGKPVDADVHIRAVAPDEVATNGDLRNKLADQVIAEFDKNETTNPKDVRANAESTNGSTPSESVGGNKVSGTEPNINEGQNLPETARTENTKSGAVGEQTGKNSSTESTSVERQAIRAKAESTAPAISERTEPRTGSDTAEPVKSNTTADIREANKAERAGTGEVPSGEADKGVKEPNVTSVKNRIVEKERIERADTPLEKTATREFGKVWDEAGKQFNEGKGKELVDELRKKPRAVTDTESALLLHQRIEARNEYYDAAKQVNENPNDLEAKARLARSSDELSELDKLTKTAGGESARGLNARRMMANEDYTLAALETRKRAALGGRQLTDTERGHLENVANEYKAKSEALEATLKERENDLAAMKSRAELAEAKREQKVQRPSIERAERIAQKLRESANADREWLKKRGAVFTAGIDPEVMIRLARIGASHLADAGLDFAKWSDKMVDEFGEKIKPHLQDIYDKAKEVAESVRPGLTEAQRLDAYKTRTEKRIAELEAKLASHDLSRKTRKPLELDRDAQQLQIDVNRLKRNFETEIIKDHLKNRSIGEKAQDFAANWARMSFLSWPTTLAKLTAAAAHRAVFAPIEEGVGAAYSKALPGLAKQSPSEAGLNVQAEAKAYTKGLWEGMKDAGRQLKMQDSDLNIQYGKREFIPPSTKTEAFMQYWGTLHGALKAPIKQIAFQRSLEKRTAFAMNNGVDVTDPAVQMSIGLEAYKDANRQIFMQDNRIVDAYKRGLNALEQRNKETGKPSVGGKALATAARIVFPVVKIPTNFAGEVMQYATGLVQGGYKLQKAYRAGIEKLPPEQADLIMRQLKKGTVGPALMLLGYFNPNAIGGYYQPGQKRDKNDVNYGSLKVFGYNVPSMLLHSPPMEMLQIGATIRRVADSKFKKSDTEARGLFAGMIAASTGVAEEVPFVKQTVEMGKLLDPREQGDYAGEFAKSRIIPGLSQYIANKTDVDAEGNTIKRKPTVSGMENFWQHLETGIPGLRENVPAAKTAQAKIATPPTTRAPRMPKMR